ncbi:zincin-like metallopeptidase domain-containing protein [Tenacibaculum geojense]|uniref:Zincin-like metallopeptidase domain-containing protein n=1 Tax=Tenacibaculum geojense TaxID=915352 RepID=A0ABW3JPK9_9FLAO
MITTRKFQQLHNTNVHKATLQQLLEEAKKENNTHVVYRIAKLLNTYPDEDYFALEIKKYNQSANSSVSINDALDSNGNLKAGWQFVGGNIVRTPPSEIPEELLAGLECIEEKDSPEALNAPVSPDAIYQMITDSMIQAIDKASGFEYTQEWDDTLTNGGYLTPTNFVSKKPYRGINYILLKNSDLFSVFSNPYFLTFNQIKDLKGKLNKGAKGLPVVYFTRLYQFEDKKKKLNFGTYQKEKMVAFLKSKGYDIKQFDTLVKIIPILKYYKVFNGADIEGIDFELEKLSDLQKAKLGYLAPKPNQGETIAFAESIIKHLPKDAAPIKVSPNGQAYYDGNKDLVFVPDFSSFKNSQDYYRVLFHELTHSTAHKKRLHRDLSGKFGSLSYAKEELVAEFGSVFLSAQAGILWKTNKNHAEYIKNWMLAISFMEKDNRLLMRAASAAQKAADYLLQVNEHGEPKFYQELKKELQKNSDEKLPPAKINDYAAWQEMVQPFYKNNVSLAYYKAAYKTTINSKKELKESIAKTYTLDKLKRLVYASGKKDNYVNAYYDNLLFLFINSSVMVGYQNTFEEKVGEIVNKADEKYLQELLDRLREKEAQRKKKIDTLKKSFKNPETLEEFQNFIRLKGEDKLTDKQLAAYDKLFVIDYHQKQKKQKIERLNYQQRINNNVEINDVELEYNENTHTKTGDIIHVLSIVDRVERDVFKKLNSLAKSNGGYYSSYNKNGAIAGFIFKTKEQSEAFETAIKKGTKEYDPEHYFKAKEAKQKERLKKLKEACYDRITEAYNNIERPRLTNTRRRQSISSSVIYDQEEIIRTNKIAINLINRIENNEIVAVKNLAYLTEVDSLIQVIERAAFDWMRNQKDRNFFTSNAPKKEDIIKNEIEFSDIKPYLQPTLLSLNKEVVVSLLKRYENKKGFKLLAKRLLKNLFVNADKKYIAYIPATLMPDFDKIMQEEKSKDVFVLDGYKRHKRLLNIIGSNNFKLLRQAAREVLTAYKEVDIYNKDQEQENKLKKLLQEVQLTKIDGFFPTPKKLTAKLLENLTIEKGDTILEPSAGIGLMAEVIKKEYPDNKLTLLEKVTTLHEICELKGFDSINMDFLKHQQKYDVIIMNPPFEKNQDIDHVLHAFSLLKDGGRLMAIMANNKEGSRIKKRQQFNDFINKYGWFKVNPSGSFKSSFKPTGVNTITVFLEKPFKQNKPKNEEEKQEATQLALFGKKPDSNADGFIDVVIEPIKITEEKKPVIAPSVTRNKTEKETPKPLKTNNQPKTRRNSLAEKRQEFKNRKVEFYNIDDADINEFLGHIEIKQTESVVITSAGGQGSGKTTFAFRLINAFAKHYTVGHASIEEAPDSNLYWQKADKYIAPERLHNIEAPKINSTSDLHKLIENNEVIVIDSFAKMQEIERGFEIDKDLRKKYNGKLFIVIFQQTSDGKMRGGTKSQFDADIVLLTEKFERFEENYVYANKNRYQNKSLDQLQYNILHGRLTSKMEEEFCDVVIR